jgi:hypothetical protein
MTAEPPEEPPYSLMCSGCYTPCSGADAHVIPTWNLDRRQVFTTYRCGNCWLPALAELRTAIASGDAEVVSGFCDFLARHGFNDTDVVRAAAPERQQEILRMVVDSVQEQRVIFNP